MHYTFIPIQFPNYIFSSGKVMLTLIKANFKGRHARLGHAQGQKTNNH